jgi:hypothetical protein
LTIFDFPGSVPHLSTLELEGQLLLSKSDVEALQSRFGHDPEEFSPIWSAEWKRSGGIWSAYHDIQINLNSDVISSNSPPAAEEAREPAPNAPLDAAAILTLEIDVLSPVRTLTERTQGVDREGKRDVTAVWEVLDHRLPFPLFTRATFDFPKNHYLPILDVKGLVMPPDGFTEVGGVVLTNRRLDEVNKRVLYTAIVTDGLENVEVVTQFLSNFVGPNFDIVKTAERASHIATLAVKRKKRGKGGN